MNKKIISLILIILVIGICLTGCGKNDDTAETSSEETKGILSSTADINLHDIDGKETNYIFTYNNEDFSAKYTKDNWHITDSYKITNKSDLAIICQALIDVHPIHGKDMKSYRTVDDLVYEWQQHNLAYMFLPNDNSWKLHAKDVDLDPADQGRSLEEMYEARTGSKLDANTLNKIKNSQKVQKVKNVKNKSKVQKIKNKLKQIFNI